MHRTHFGRKKMSQNRAKLTPRVTYNFKKPKNPCPSKKNPQPNRSKFVERCRHVYENAHERKERT